MYRGFKVIMAFYYLKIVGINECANLFPDWGIDSGFSL